MNKKITFVVAHPDDEVIWFAPFFNKDIFNIAGLDFSRCSKEIICLTCGDNKIRSDEFRKILDRFNLNGKIMDIPIKRGISYKNYKQINIAIRKLYKTKPDIVITHCLYGEDHFHPQHILTSISCFINSLSTNSLIISSASNRSYLSNMLNAIHRTNFISIKSISFLFIKIFLITLDLLLFKKMPGTFKAEATVIKDSIDIYESQSTDYERFNNNKFRYAKLRPTVGYLLNKIYI